MSFKSAQHYLFRRIVGFASIFRATLVEVTGFEVLVCKTLVKVNALEKLCGKKPRYRTVFKTVSTKLTKDITVI